MINALKCTICLLLTSVGTWAVNQATGPPPPFVPEAGDLLFQDLDCGPLCDAIETVTHGAKGADFSHVGVVSAAVGNEVWVTEAVSAGVKRTPLSEFLSRSRDANGLPKVVVGRLKPAYRGQIAASLRRLSGYLGRPYDAVYQLGDVSYYCAELVEEAFGLFPAQPMTFRDPASGQTFPAWADHYRALGVAVPEGMPGLNPGGLSRSEAIELVHCYGRPDGWQGDLTW